MLFLTGGSGFLGRRFLELCAEQRKIVALQRVHPIQHPAVAVVQGDLLCLDSLIQGTQGCRAIVHCGGATPNCAYRDGNFEATVRGTKNLLEAAKHNGIERFVFVSSSSVATSTGPYALSKLEAEAFVRDSGLNWTILRPKTLVGGGARDLGRMLSAWAKARWIPVIGDGEYRKQPLFVDDLCQALGRLLENDQFQHRIVAAAGGEAVAFNEFVRSFASALGNQRFRLVHVPVALVRPIASLANRIQPRWGLNRERVQIITSSHWVDPSEFAALLGRELASFEEMVTRTVASWPWRTGKR